MWVGAGTDVPVGVVAVVVDPEFSFFVGSGDGDWRVNATSSEDGVLSSSVTVCGAKSGAAITIDAVAP